ncbi:Peptidoglycan D,D-transpeptidase FtsI [Fundidesulfovibrio magnetotacticus]|uniref:Peptidoglycan D,D-transpeptidase FtsI n=1 Tax=Fundidesulfovibrio magnetotacticus TaxID=2730080 RepID=A0A6V8LV63_9BACT|nr:penicillin-binding transpeptidase domain-containing protein [Fundidesulfovibrio magnetotacticus]GFK93557.1 Peptidoglycan D,D-transpeptidase FtsI [Fundidesulfovibrio magnetotacticus]
MSRGQKQIRDYSRIRLIVVCGVFFLFWASLWVRAAHLQIVQGPRLAEQALRQHLALETDRGRRGAIVDRNGQLLAKSVEFASVYANPKDVKNPDEAAQALSKVLGEPLKDLTRKLHGRGSFVYLDRRVNDRVAAQVRALNIPGVHVAPEFGRSYPNKQMAGQLLGFVGYDDQGLEGLEKHFEAYLAGKKAKYVVQRDASGRRLYLDAQGREMANADGAEIRLTIDSQIQFFAEEALAKAVTENRGKAGICIVVHVKSAEILAWANYPFFNPNGGDNPDPKAGRNRLALDVLEPGSTMKPILIAAALQEKVIRPETQYNCEKGQWNFYNIATIRDTHPYDVISVDKILRWSSNIGAAKIGLDLGAHKLHAYFDRVGFGQPTGLPLPGEAKGLMRPVSAWSKLDLATCSFGQGIGVTPVQLAQAFHVIANNGVKKPLRLVMDPPQDSSFWPETRVFDPQVAKTVQLMMRDVVEAEKGTGVKAHIDGLELGGKTGTAQKARARGGYGDKYLANFVGFVPAVDPEYMVLVMVDEPEPNHYGGVVAAPAMREVALKSLSYLGRLPESVKMQQADKGPAPAPVRASDVAEALGVAFPPMNIAVDGAEVPNLVGMPLRKAAEILAGKGVVPTLKGSGLVVGKQNPAPGAHWDAVNKEPFTIWLAKAS